MLSMASLSSASGAASYFSNAVGFSDYFTADHQLGQSQWGGKAAAELGLSGPVDGEIFENVLSGHLPNGVVLTGGAKEHAPGFDLTFSAPKSISLISLVGGDTRLIRAHHAAVLAAMKWAETNLAEARMGRDGHVVVATGKLAYALFTHDVSRELDPQLHTHGILANLTLRPDGEYRALHNGKIWKANMLIGAIYHNELRHNVKALGYSIEEGGKNGTFEIAVSRQVIEAWSQRHQQIRGIAERLGITSHKGRRSIAERSRGAKTEIDPASIRQAWQALAKERGHDFQSMIPQMSAPAAERGVLAKIRSWGEALLARVTPFFRPARENLTADNNNLRRVLPLDASYAVAASARHLSEREAVFKDHNLLQHALNFASNGARIGDVEARVAHLKAEGALISGKGEQQGMLTTPDMVKLERQMIAFARGGIGKAVAQVSVERATTLIDEAAAKALNMALNLEQRQAATAILASTDRYVAIQGGAGSGKSSVFSAVNAVDPKSRDALLILTPQAKLASELTAESGIEARTLSWFLTRHERLVASHAKPSITDRKNYSRTTLIIDEASMVSNRQLHGLMQITEKLGINKLVMVGDIRQIAAVEAGSPFRQLQELALKPILLEKNMRQRGDDMKIAVAKLQAGLVREAFQTLGNRVIENSDPVASAAKAWLALDDKARSNTALFTSGHQLRARLLETVRSALVKEGKLGTEEIKLPTLENLNMTREQIRSINSYAAGLVVDVHRDTPAIGLERGSYRVLSADPNTLEVTVSGTKGEHLFRPEKLHPSGTGISLSRPSEIAVRTGDTLLWTANDKHLDAANGQTVKLQALDSQTMTLTNQAGKTIKLGADDPMRERLAHGLAMNMHKSQGLTVQNAITVMSSDDRMLNTQSLAYVLSSRAREGFSLHVDNAEKLIAQIEANSGQKASALDLVATQEKEAMPKQEVGGRATSQVISKTQPPDKALNISLPEKHLDLSL